MGGTLPTFGQWCARRSFGRTLFRVVAAICLLTVPEALGDPSARTANCLGYLAAVPPDAEAPMDGRYPSGPAVGMLRGLMGRLAAWRRGDATDVARAQDLSSDLTYAILGPLNGNARRTNAQIREAIREVLVRHGLQDFADRNSPSANMALTLLASVSANPTLVRSKRLAQAGRGADRLPGMVESSIRQLLDVASEISRTLGMIERYDPATAAPRPVRPVQRIEGTHSETEAKDSMAVSDFLTVSRDGSHVGLFLPTDAQRELSTTETIVGAPMVMTVSLHAAKGNWGVERPDGSAALFDNERLTDVLENVPAYRSDTTRAIFLNACNSAVAGSRGRAALAETVMRHSGKVVIGVNGTLHTVQHNGSTYTWVEREHKMISLEDALVMFVPGRAEPERIRRPDLLFPDTQFVGTNSAESIRELLKEAREAVAR